jgi:peptidoglycan-N-acetylglucosamine deacetylase
MSRQRPPASLSLDLDNAWSYLKTRGDESWREWPSYLDVVVPLALDLLARLDLRITFFVVGRDAAEPANGPALRSLAAAGHEIGNHSFLHEPWLHRYDDDRLEDELDRAEAAIDAAVGVRPTGFRGPGYSVSVPLLRSLARRGYAYDASTLPTFVGPLARAYYFRTARLDAAQREERAALFGAAADGLRPVTPYRWDVAGGRLVEMPVTTFPGARVPMHLSYVLYLERAGRRAALAYFRAALAACRVAGVQPSILLHPLDLVGSDDLGEVGAGLRFFPGMDLPGERKRDLVATCLAMMADRFEVLPVGAHAGRLPVDDLPLVAPRFRQPAA